MAAKAVKSTPLLLLLELHPAGGDVGGKGETKPTVGVVGTAASTVIAAAAAQIPVVRMDLEDPERAVDNLVDITMVILLLVGAWCCVAVATAPPFNLNNLQLIGVVPPIREINQNFN